MTLVLSTNIDKRNTVGISKDISKQLQFRTARPLKSIFADEKLVLKRSIVNLPMSVLFYFIFLFSPKSFFP